MSPIGKGVTASATSNPHSDNIDRHGFRVQLLNDAIAIDSAHTGFNGIVDF